MSCDVKNNDSCSGGTCIFRSCLMKWNLILPAAIFFTLIVQGATGFCLRLYYSSSATTAWESVYYIQNKVAGGWLLRAVHHYTAQILLVLVMVYIAALVFSGLYRWKRSATVAYILAVLLFLCCLVTMLTGDLLAWDQNSLAATKARVSYLNVLPIIGTPLNKLAVGGPEFGTMTLTRFTTLHTTVFGIATIGIGLLLAVSVTWKQILTDRPKLLRQAILWGVTWIVVAIVILSYSTAVDPASGQRGVFLGSPADPNPLNAYEAARPEWAFLGLYRFALFGVFEHREILPVFIIPGLLAFYALAAPWIGIKRIGHYFTMALGTFLFIGLVILSRDVIKNDKKNEDFQLAVNNEIWKANRAIALADKQGIPPGGALTMLDDDPLVGGRLLFEKNCAICHSYSGPGKLNMQCDPQTAPDLYRFARHDWIVNLFDPDKFESTAYFGGTKFAKGIMAQFLRDKWPSLRRQDEMLLALAAESRLGTRPEGEFPIMDEEEPVTDDAESTEGDDQESEEKEVPKLSLEEMLKKLEDDSEDLADDIEKGQKEIAKRCTGCHHYRGEGPIGPAPTLDGYGSREWLTGIILDPAHPYLYGPHNDRMPASAGSFDSPRNNALTYDQVAVLVDFMRGEWVVTDRPQLAPAAELAELEAKADAAAEPEPVLAESTATTDEEKKAEEELLAKIEELRAKPEPGPAPNLPINRADVIAYIWKQRLADVSMYYTSEDWSDEEIAAAKLAPVPLTSAALNDEAPEGARLFVANRCNLCHRCTDPETGEGIGAITPMAPDLYGFGTSRWTLGVLDPSEIVSDRYFGLTEFKGGSMVTFIRTTYQELEKEERAAIEKALTVQADPNWQPADDAEAAMVAEGIELINEESLCAECHHPLADPAKPLSERVFENILTIDLTGYASDAWTTDFLSDPTTARFYGPSPTGKSRNDGMPAYHPFPAADDEGKNMMTLEEINTICRWLRNPFPKAAAAPAQ